MDRLQAIKLQINSSEPGIQRFFKLIQEKMNMNMQRVKFQKLQFKTKIMKQTAPLKVQRIIELSNLKMILLQGMKLQAGMKSILQKIRILRKRRLKDRRQIIQIIMLMTQQSLKSIRKKGSKSRRLRATLPREKCRRCSKRVPQLSKCMILIKCLAKAIKLLLIN